MTKGQDMPYKLFFSQLKNVESIKTFQKLIEIFVQMLYTFG